MMYSPLTDSCMVPVLCFRVCSVRVWFVLVGCDTHVNDVTVISRAEFVVQRRFVECRETREVVHAA